MDKKQAWFWTKRWQEGKREADKDIRAGRVYSFANAQEAIAFLHGRVKRGKQEARSKKQEAPSPCGEE